MKRKKILCALMSIILAAGTFGAFPAKAEADYFNRDEFYYFGDVDFGDLFDRCVQWDGYLELQHDVYTDEEHVVTAGHDIILNLNGYSIYGVDDSTFNCDDIFELKERAKMTIVDNSEEANGKIQITSTNWGYDQIIYVDQLAELILLSGSIVGGNGTSYRGVYVDEGYFTMKGGAIRDIKCKSYDGGAVYVYEATWGDTNSASFTMEGGVISGCTADTRGGAVYCNTGKVYLESGLITGCSTTDIGGAVDIYKGFIYISGDAEISGNTARSGAGVYVYDGGMSMTGGKIKDNHTSGESESMQEGGGVFFNGTDTLTFYMSGGDISGNSAYKGGGIYFADGYAELKGGSIRNNTAHDGAGIFIEYDFSPDMDEVAISGSTVITGNAADYRGGGVYLDSVSNSCPLYLGGKIQIWGNTKNATGQPTSSDLFFFNPRSDDNIPVAVSDVQCAARAAQHYGIDPMDTSAQNHAWIGLDSTLNLTGSSSVPGCWVALSDDAQTRCFFADDGLDLAAYQYDSGSGYVKRLVADETPYIKSGETRTRDYLRLSDIDADMRVVPEDAVITKDSAKRYLRIEFDSDEELYTEGNFVLSFTDFITQGADNMAGTFTVTPETLEEFRERNGCRILRYTFLVRSSGTVNEIPYARKITGNVNMFCETWWTVDVAVRPIAGVEGDYYDTIEEAVAAAGTTKEIQLFRDATYVGLTGSGSPLWVWDNGHTFNVSTPEGFGVYLYYYWGANYYCNLFYAQSVSTTGEMIANFYLKLPEQLQSHASDYTVGLSYTGENGPVERSELLSNGTAKNGYSVFSISLPVKEMGETITGLVRDGNDNIVSGKTYSITQYYRNMITGDHSDVMKALAVAALKYGGAAQRYFDWKTETPADSILTEEGVSDIVSTLDVLEAPEQKDEAWYIYDNSQNIDGIQFFAQSLLFKGETAIRFYLKADDPSVLNECVFTGKDVTTGLTYQPLELSYSLSNNMYFVEISGIPAKNIGDTFEVSVSHGEDTGKLTYSPLTYIYNKYNSDDEDLKELVRSMYSYYLNAKRYAESK